MPSRERSKSSLVGPLSAARAAGRPLPRTATDAVRRLVAGNEAFTRMAEAGARGEKTVVEFDPLELGFDGGRSAPVQRPFAAVLGCSDARVPLEMVFQQRSNDVFVVRVAGNGIGLGGLGSFRYAAANFADSLRLVVVLGHSQCGAVSAAVNAAGFVESAGGRIKIVEGDTRLMKVTTGADLAAVERLLADSS